MGTGTGGRRTSLRQTRSRDRFWYFADPVEIDLVTVYTGYAGLAGQHYNLGWTYAGSDSSTSQLTGMHFVPPGAMSHRTTCLRMWLLEAAAPRLRIGVPRDAGTMAACLEVWAHERHERKDQVESSTARRDGCAAWFFRGSAAVRDRVALSSSDGLPVDEFIWLRICDLCGLLFCCVLLHGLVDSTVRERYSFYPAAGQSTFPAVGGGHGCGRSAAPRGGDSGLAMAEISAA